MQRNAALAATPASHSFPPPSFRGEKRRAGSEVALASPRWILLLSAPHDIKFTVPNAGVLLLRWPPNEMRVTSVFSSSPPVKQQVVIPIHTQITPPNAPLPPVTLAFGLCSAFYTCILLSGILAADCSGCKWSLAESFSGEWLFVVVVLELTGFSCRWHCQLIP